MENNFELNWHSLLEDALSKMSEGDRDNFFQTMEIVRLVNQINEITNQINRGTNE